MQPRLIVEQKITIFVNKYSVYAATADGSKGQLAAYVQQKRLAFKEKVNFYSDESKAKLLFTFRAEKVFDVHGRYFVEDAEGNLIGSFQKQFAKSLISSTWDILDTNGKPKINVTESSHVIALLRRISGLIPYVGGLVEIIVLLFRYHFKFIDSTSGAEVGRYQKTTLVRDHYLLSMTDDAYKATDWRVLAAMAVALDALQSR